MAKEVNETGPIVFTPTIDDPVGYIWRIHTYWERLFLAGSIEMGNAVMWQQFVIDQLTGCKFKIFNPRRSDWDNSWGEDSSELIDQIKWELKNIKEVDIVLFYFDPETTSPVSLAELYLMLEKAPTKLIVVCPDGYFRKTNVVVTCMSYGVHVHSKLDDAIRMLRSM